MPSVEARITKVEQSGDWYRIFTDDERIPRLDTKIAEKAKEAAQLKKTEQLALIDYTERQGNINEHTGRPYMNRYYEKAGALAKPEPDEDDGIERAQPTSQEMQRKTDPTDAWRMCLNKGGELAVATLPLMKEGQRDFADQRAIAIAWATVFFATPPPGMNGSSPPADDHDFEQPPPRGDDDIPF